MNQRQRARLEHAWLLRAEGLGLREIAIRLGVGTERVRTMILQFAGMVGRATRHTKFRVS